MALAMAYDEAKNRQERHERSSQHSSGGLLNTPFFSFRDDPELPHATLNQHDAGRYSSAHYHIRDQFQVVVEGKAKFGRHDVTPYCVHFARAYTPYGPLNMDVKEGLTFFAMRAHRDAGAQRLPDKREALRSIPNREPWQLTRRFEFPPVPAGHEYYMRADPEMQDSMGLGAYSLVMKANACAKAPDPSRTGGQYVVILKGSLQHEGKGYPAPALIFVKPHEGALSLIAGAAGMQGLILNFPQVSARAGVARPESATQSWQCDLCSFAYDEAKGLPEEGIPAGTRWEDIPEDWTCPDCGTGKRDFRKVE